MAAGDDGALAVLYDSYGHVAYALAFAITGVQERAEGAVCQAFAEAWRSAASFDVRQTSVRAWLTSFVRRAALKRTARSSNRRNPDRPVWSASVCPVGDALRSLTSVQQQVIELSYYRGLSVGEIAAHLGEPESGTRELLRSAMHELRTALDGGCRTPFDEHVMTRA
jgi:RNA polymerase sigma-70 factor (ECF subfamily)